jgi:hypothetical protein
MTIASPTIDSKDDKALLRRSLSEAPSEDLKVALAKLNFDDRPERTRQADPCGYLLRH